MSITVKDHRGTSPFGLVFRDHIDTDKFRALTPCARIVYLSLTTFAGSSGQCWPKQKTLSDLTGYAPRSIRRAVHELEAARYLAVEIRDPSSWRRTNVYTLLKP